MYDMFFVNFHFFRMFLVRRGAVVVVVGAGIEESDDRERKEERKEEKVSIKGKRNVRRWS